MRPNGVIHSHEIDAITYDSCGEIVKVDTYVIPDKQFHDLRAYLEKFKRKPC